MFAQAHSLGPAITPPSALPGVRSGDNDDDNDVDDIYIMMQCLSVCNEKSSLSQKVCLSTMKVT